MPTESSQLSRRRSLRRFATHPATVSVLLAAWLLSFLLTTSGLFEEGDANFPIRAPILEQLRAWDNQNFFGYDNITTGVPRLSYTLVVWLLTAALSSNTAQYILYVLVFALMGWSMYQLLATWTGNRLAAAVGAAIYTWNPWTLDRVGHLLVLQAYAALPLAIYCYLRSLETRSVRYPFLFALSTLLIIPSLHVSYLAGVVLVAVATGAIAQRGVRVVVRRSLATLGWTTAIAAFYVLPMLYGMVITQANSVTHSVSRFSDSSFLYYGKQQTLAATLRLAGFHGSKIPLELHWWTVTAFAVVTLAVIGLWHSSYDRSRKVVLGFLLGFGLLMAAGGTTAPQLTLAVRRFVPGMAGFIDPNFFVVFVAFALAALAAGGLKELLVSQRWRRVAGTVVASVGVFGLGWPHLAFLSAAFPQTTVPAAYTDTTTAAVFGTLNRIYWLPTFWVTQYEWSGSFLSGFQALLSPVPVVNNVTLELTPERSLELIKLLRTVLVEHPHQLTGLLRLAGVDGLLIPRDLVATTAQELPEQQELSALTELATELASQEQLLTNEQFSLFRVAPSEPTVRVTTSPTVYAGPIEALGDVTEILGVLQPATDSSPTLVMTEGVADQSLMEGAPGLQRAATVTYTPLTQRDEEADQVSRIGNDPISFAVTGSGTRVFLKTEGSLEGATVNGQPLRANAVRRVSPSFLELADRALAPENTIAFQESASVDWEIAGTETVDVTPDLAGIPTIERRLLTTDAGPTLEVSTTRHVAGTRWRVDQLTPGTRYQLEFVYRTVAGGQPYAAVEALHSVTGAGLGVLTTTYLKPADDWTHARIAIRATTESLYLYLYTVPEGRQPGVTQWANARITDLSNLVEATVVVTEPTAELGQISSMVTPSKRSALRYQLTLGAVPETGVVVALAESFHPGWQLIDRETGARVGTHLVVNGALNGWYLPAGSPNKLTLSYYPERLRLIGLAVSVLTVLGTTSWLWQQRRVVNHHG